MALGSKPVGMLAKRVEYRRFTRSEVCRFGHDVSLYALSNRLGGIALLLRCFEEVVGAAIDGVPRVLGELPAPDRGRKGHL